MNDNSLYDFHKSAVLEVSPRPQFNWVKKFECRADEIDRIAIVDVQEVAEKWRSLIVPDDFYFTHAQYYKDGIEHIIKELKNKPTSNRALYSLLSQDDISNSDDEPRPSFLSLQCQLDGSTLVCTCYFRALEVAIFLRINIEEIRQTLSEICQGLSNVERVELTIFAFRAYANDKMHPLVKPELEYIRDDDLQVAFIKGATNPSRRLHKIIKELQGAITIVSPERLVALQRILSKSSPGLVMDEGLSKKMPQILPILSRAIDAAQNLMKVRGRSSHGSAVVSASDEYQANIKAILDILDI